MHTTSTLADRINKVLTDNGLVKPDGTPHYAKAERLAGIKGTVLSKVVQRKGDLHDSNKEKFLRTFHVNPAWFDTGKGPEYLLKDDENLTSARNSSGNKGIDLDEMLEKVESSRDYFVIPRAVLKENYRLVAIEQYQLEKEKLEQERIEYRAEAEKDRINLEAHIASNRDLLAHVIQLSNIIAQLSQVQKSKE